jgi:hypothetical protein
LALGLLVTSPALGIAEVDLADLGAPVSQATLEVDDASNVNPGDYSPFTSWTENGVVVTPAAGEEGSFASGNGAVGLLFAIPPGGFGDGTAVIVFDEAQRALAIEVGFQQDYVRVALFEDAAGTVLIDTIILGDPELDVPNLPLFAVRSPVLFRRAQLQDVNALGEVQNSNMISDLRFTAVPEPSPPLLVALAVAGATWLRRRR